MALDDWELRPSDGAYYAERTDYARQGDVFQDVPLGYPLPAEAFDHTAGRRKFLSGPFEPGFGMLLTPTCSFFAQGEPGRYAHPVRTLAPVLPLDELGEKGVVKQGALDDLRTHDHLVNYFYLPVLACRRAWPCSTRQSRSTMTISRSGGSHSSLRKPLCI